MVSTITASLPENRLDAVALSEWLAALPPPAEPNARKRLVKATEQLRESLEGQTERSGQLTALYVLNVADILVQLGLDDDTLAAAVLHRLVSLEKVSAESIREDFGEDIAHMVEDVVRIARLVPGILAARKLDKGEDVENLRRLFLEMSNDVRVLLIVLAERVHLMRRLRYLPEDIQTQYSQNTRDVFAPIANRLGVWQVKWELEDLSLRFLEPGDYRDIARQLDGRRKERLDYMAEVKATLRDAFEKEGIQADISGRPKHIYSIWKKMKRKDVGLGRIFDLRALRVLVDTVAECYAALGVVHSLWRHIPGEFDDYIATPKANLYQSIHTVVIGPGDKPLEIQIRTHDMHEHAERGVAAHWQYKEQRGSGENLERRIRWLRRWLESRDDKEGDTTLARDLDADLEPSLVYVLSPQGKVIELPYGSTPVDFAYAIHTSVGHRCRGARVDGRMVPLTHRLESGTTVEILTVKEGGPSRDWVRASTGYVHTSRARERIRQWFKQLDYDKHLSAGRAALDRELARLNRERPKLEEVAAKSNFKSVDDLLAAVGRGDVSAIHVAGTGALRVQPVQPEDSKQLAAVVSRRRRGQKPKSGGQVRVEGVDDLMTSLAKCCRPLPGDSIIGFITRGRGVTVHRSDCKIIDRLGDEDRHRLVSVVWGREPEEGVYTAGIKLVAADRKGLLRDISAVFANEDVDVTNVRTQSNVRHQRAVMNFSVQVESTRKLDRLMEKLLHVPDVYEVTRAR